MVIIFITVYMMFCLYRFIVHKVYVHKILLDAANNLLRQILEQIYFANLCNYLTFIL